MTNIPRGAQPVEVVDGELRIVAGQEPLVLRWDPAKGTPRYATIDSHAVGGGSHVVVTWTIRILDAEGVVLDTHDYEEYY